jgi:NTP pyrophosphatase (non-canonical NTP hydrolase)
MTHFALENEHTQMVKVLSKNPAEIGLTLTHGQIDLIHASLGIAGEAGELIDAIKKYAIYNKPLDLENVIEELGDLEFYIAMIRERLSITREVVLHHNITKLAKRYPAGYTDAAAQARADKVQQEQGPVQFVETLDERVPVPAPKASMPIHGITTTDHFK